MRRGASAGAYEHRREHDAADEPEVHGDPERHHLCQGCGDEKAHTKVLTVGDEALHLLAAVTERERQRYSYGTVSQPAWRERERVKVFV